MDLAKAGATGPSFVLCGIVGALLTDVATSIEGSISLPTELFELLSSIISCASSDCAPGVPDDVVGKTRLLEIMPVLTHPSDWGRWGLLWNGFVRCLSNEREWTEDNVGDGPQALRSLIEGAGGACSNSRVSGGNRSAVPKEKVREFVRTGEVWVRFGSAVAKEGGDWRK